MSTDSVTHIRHIGVSVPNFSAECSFIADIWGLPLIEADADIAYFAAASSANAYVYRLRRGSERRLDVIAFALGTNAAVDAMADRLGRADVKLISEPDILPGPGGGYGFRFFDCDGRTLEVSSSVGPRAPRELGRGESIPGTLSHVVLHTPDIRRSVAFYAQHLGFRVSDWLGDFMCFLRCNAVHHCLAFLPGPPCLNHVAFEMRDLDEMMRGIGRLARQNVALGWGPGRHTAGNNTFAYFLAPSGHVLEYTAEVQRVEESTWQPTVYAPAPEITDQWGTGSMSGGGPHKLGAPSPDPGLWTPPPL